MIFFKLSEIMWKWQSSLEKGFTLLYWCGQLKTKFIISKNLKSFQLSLMYRVVHLTFGIWIGYKKSLWISSQKYGFIEKIEPFHLRMKHICTSSFKWLPRLALQYPIRSNQFLRTFSIVRVLNRLYYFENGKENENITKNITDR